ncbi:MAG TPA: alkaline phosphatase D family protein [Gammaproteobacteria bacterium]|nr:alkaline phosphatase D family protein [Gammaproteobacteria bacterium]
MAELIVGPMLRYVGDDEATIWVETDAPCEVNVQVSGAAAEHLAKTFCVLNHHYAIVRLTDLEVDQAYPYTVLLDGEQVWPEAGSGYPPSVIRTISAGALRIAFGSCRVYVPHEPPYTEPMDDDERGRGIDALNAFALRMREQDVAEWPDLLLLVGDQIYGDDVSPGTREFIKSRRNPDEPPGYEIADFEEYTHLYAESWRDPAVRWLLSTVSSVMIFDDHDVSDDWNISEAWIKEMRDKPWWDARICGAFMSYWLYQHLGNLSPDELYADEVFCEIQEAGDGTELLRKFAYRADRNSHTTRWSYHRDFGNTRLVMLDSRASRVLENDERAMIDDQEWHWVERYATGGFDHLLIGTSLPFVTSPGIHYLEAFDEALCRGVWGQRFARWGESLRRWLDLEHWPAFQHSYHELAALLQRVAAGECGRAPASIILLSGDVHHAYVSRATFRHHPHLSSVLYQLVCSPFRNALGKKERRIMRIGWRRFVPFLLRLLARAAGVPRAPLDWELMHPKPWFNNQIALLELQDGQGFLKIEKTIPGDSPGNPVLEEVFSHELSRD